MGGGGRGGAGSIYGHGFLSYGTCSDSKPGSQTAMVYVSTFTPLFVELFTLARNFVLLLTSVRNMQLYSLLFRQSIE